MSSNEELCPDTMQKWLHPNEFLKLQRLKLKKKKLQARINKSETKVSPDNVKQDFNVSLGAKRSNPFIKTSENNKRTKLTVHDESCDQTLFQLLHFNDANKSNHYDALNRSSLITNGFFKNEVSEVHNKSENTWVPIDWGLNTKLRLLSTQPFVWNHKLKISEEASGITAFVRCLNNKSTTTLDTSPNAQFHQCCLYWQQPYFPWLNLFPRSQANSTGISIASTSSVRDSLHMAWSDSLRSLFQLLRTRQCPYFYVSTNTFTVLFRAAGICGYTEMNALISHTTCGFRQMLKQEDIEFTMPLRKKKCEENNILNYEDNNTDEDEPPDDQWLESMGIDAEDRKRINYTQKRMIHKVESKIDNTEQSLVFIKGMEVHGLYNFLINCKSATSVSGPLAGIPPTLLSPIAFQGATLCALKVKEGKIQIEKQSYFSIELTGPILPHVIHSLSQLNPSDQNFTATFSDVPLTTSFSKAYNPESEDNENIKSSGSTVFGQENLSDCGLTSSILKHFCSSYLKLVQNVESLKYSPERKSYTWL